MKLFYRIVKALYLWLAPLIMVLLSVILVSTNANIYKDILRENNFYPKAATALQNTIAPESVSNENIPRSLVFFSVIRQSVTDIWLQTFFEKNIDATIGWMRGDKESWVVFVPVSDINSAITAQVDEASLVILQNQNLAICSLDEANKIQQNGYQNLTSATCIPESIKNGQQSFSQFFSLQNNTNPLNTLLPNSPFNTLNDQFEIEKIISFTGQTGIILKGLSLFRSVIISIQNLTIPLFIVMIILGFLLIILARIANYSVIQQIQSTSTTLAFSIIFLCFSIFATLSVSLFLTGEGGNAFIPGARKAGVFTLVVWNGIEFIFITLVPALGAAVSLFIVSLAARFAKYLSVQSQQVKNNDILSHQPRPELSNTFDGQFKQQVAQTQAEINKNSIPKDTHFEQFYNPETLSTQQPDDEIFFTGKPDEIEEFYKRESDFLQENNAKELPKTQENDKQIPGF